MLTMYVESTYMTLYGCKRLNKDSDGSYSGVAGNLS